MRLILAVLIALSMAAPLAGCGKKGDPKLPQGESDNYPRKYPSE